MQRGKQLADRALVQSNGELSLDPSPQINTPPAHDAILRQVRTSLDPAGHRGLLGIGEARFRAVATFPVREALHPARIVAVDPIAQGLPVHAATPRRIAPRVALHDQRDCQHAPRRLRILTRAASHRSSAADKSSRVISTAISPPELTNGTSESQQSFSRDHIRVIGRGRWYDLVSAPTSGRTAEGEAAPSAPDDCRHTDAT